MSLAEIKSAVDRLSPKELAELIAFLRERDSAAWDRQIEEDAASGKLDFLFEEAESTRVDRHAALDRAFGCLSAEEAKDLEKAALSIIIT